MNTLYYIILTGLLCYPLFWCLALFGSSLIFLIGTSIIIKRGWWMGCQKRKNHKLHKHVRIVHTLDLISGVTDTHR